MQGKNACWVPGTDHASIATEAKVVQMLREKGIKKSDLSREDFLKHAWGWKEKYGGMITEQFRRMLNGDSSQGRKLEFIGQEMFREINTTGSKANNVTIALSVVEMKAAIERMREVLQNVE